MTSRKKVVVIDVTDDANANWLHRRKGRIHKATKAASVSLIKQYGEMWGRTLVNISKIPKWRDVGPGIYILYDGSTPVYIGRGNIRARLRQHRLSKRVGQLWDHFSWYVPWADCTHDLEALLLRMLPLYLRYQTRQRGHFQEATKISVPLTACDLITRRVPPRRPSRKGTR
jgi:hypothetical protein